MRSIDFTIFQINMNTELFHTHIRHTILSNDLFAPQHDTLLVGVSGGVDSMVMLHTLHSLGCKLHIAHCNFMLRNQESNDDEALVIQYAQTLSIPISTIQFNTREYATQHHISIEMAARDLRYTWFKKISAEYNCTKIIVAHNQNDSIETFFINLLRGSGIKGLQGIPMKNGTIVRPLLTTTRAQIEAYAKQNNITYRTDSSNLENDYVRNKIRNKVLPLLQQIAPDAQQAIATSMQNLQQTYAVYKHTILTELQQITENTPNGCIINEQALLQHQHSPALAFELLHPYGFNSDVIQQIIASFGSQSGKQFESPSHKAIHDRNTLYIEARKHSKNFCKTIPLAQSTIQTPYGEFICTINNVNDIHIQKNRNTAYLDADKLSQELTLRPWKPGDSFVPFGMYGTKKVSDYLIDEKVPLHTKQDVLVLQSNNDIVWLVGYTIHNSYAITNNTKRVFCVKKID